MLASDFGNATVLTCTFMRDILGSNDKNKICENVSDLHLFKIGLENLPADYD